MSAYNWRIGAGRGPSLIPPQTERTATADGARWVIGQNVKRRLPDHRYDAVRKYWMKERRDGKAVTVDWTFDVAEARAWIGVGDEVAL